MGQSIEQVKKNVSQLEKNILQLLLEFNLENELYIRDVDVGFERVSSIGGNITVSYITHVKVDLDV